MPADLTDSRPNCIYKFSLTTGHNCVEFGFLVSIGVGARCVREFEAWFVVFGVRRAAGYLLCIVGVEGVRRAAGVLLVLFTSKEVFESRKLLFVGLLLICWGFEFELGVAAGFSSSTATSIGISSMAAGVVSSVVTSAVSTPLLPPRRISPLLESPQPVSPCPGSPPQ
ncbi:hypothetical protein Droror1_Dr00022110 [Drosera rotundifolia]